MVKGAEFLPSYMGAEDPPVAKTIAERILRILDSYHAMITSGREAPILRFWRGAGRMYQLPFSLQDAASNIMAKAGVHFDAELTPRVLHILKTAPQAIRLSAEFMRPPDLGYYGF